MAGNNGKPNGVPSSKDPSVQRLYAELDRIRAETLDPDNCSVQRSRDRMVVLRQRQTSLHELFLLMVAEQGAIGE